MICGGACNIQTVDWMWSRASETHDVPVSVTDFNNN